MPNHVVNHLNFVGESTRIKELLNTIKNEEFGFGSIDFNKIIPMPEELNISGGEELERGLQIYKAFIEVLTFDGANSDIDLLNIPEEKEKIFLKARTSIDEEEWNLGKQAYKNIHKYRYPNWYGWCIDNWGPKWNAYYCSEFNEATENCTKISFNTSYSAPHSVVKKLSLMFPDVEIVHEWADQDFGVNLGRKTLKSGEEIERFKPNLGKEAFEFGKKVWGLEKLEEVGLTLNATGNNYVSIWDDDYDVVEFREKHMLYTLEKISLDDVPKGYNIYEIKMDSTNTYFDTLEKGEAIRHGGTLITKEEIDFGDGACIDLEEEPVLFVGMHEVSFEQFENGEIEIIEGMEMA